MHSTPRRVPPVGIVAGGHPDGDRDSRDDDATLSDDT
jgi:hypothetical protein